MPLYTRKLGGKSGNPKLQIDLIEVLHRIESDTRKIRAITPIIKREDVKQEFGARIVEEILKRTNKGVDKDDKGFKSYSKTYRQSDIFKIYKGRKLKPDLKLTGEMQSSLNVVKTTATGVIISFIDQEDGSKARGHIVGDNPNKMPIRDFFGLPDEDIEKIMNETIKEYTSGSLQAQMSLMDAVLGEPILATVGDQSAFLGEFLLGTENG